MPIRLAIDARLLGQKRPILTDWSMTLPLDLTGQESRLPLREILTEVVLAEVEAFLQRQEERRLVRILGPDPLAAGVAGGKVDLGDRDLGEVIDAQDAVPAAL